jgi:hypothetical protein
MASIMDFVRFLSFSVVLSSFSVAHTIPQHGIIPRQGMVTVFLSFKALHILAIKSIS